MPIQTYLGMLDLEIGKLIEKESKGLSTSGEQALHILLENRKHVKRLLEEKSSAGMEESGNPNKSYFGGEM